jgi:hypothetical protein
MTEQRKSPRYRVFKKATIAFNRAGGIDCMVRNISDGGACLDVASPLGIPSDFDLLFTSDHAVRPCHVVWRTERRIGVAFH